MEHEPYDTVKIDLSWLNRLTVDEYDTITAEVFVEPLLLFCQEMLEKYEIKEE